MKKIICLVVLGLFLNGFATLCVAQDANQKVVCKGLSEKECKENKHCIAIMGPSYCSSGGYCTQDMAKSRTVSR
jgi:hypothetical protein